MRLKGPLFDDIGGGGRYPFSGTYNVTVRTALRMASP